jgi:hypothetical protein
MAQNARSLYPAPPDYFTLFENEDTVPPPPAPITGSFTTFGIESSSSVAIPSLQGADLIPPERKEISGAETWMWASWPSH